MSLTPFFGLRGMCDPFFHNDPFFSFSNPFSCEPQAHARESADALLLEIDLPRFNPEEVHVNVDAESGHLTVKGERPHQPARGFDHFLFGAAQPTQFSRTFFFSPATYDLTKATQVLERGVLYITVPKRPQPPVVEPTPVLLFDGRGQRAAAIAERKASSGEMVATTTSDNNDNEEPSSPAYKVALLQRAQWPPRTEVEENESVFKYVFDLPVEVTAHNLTAKLVGRTLSLQVATSHKQQGASRSVTYTQSFAVPEGTAPENIHTEFEPGKFTVIIDKAPAPGDKKQQHVPVSQAPEKL